MLSSMCCRASRNLPLRTASVLTTSHLVSYGKTDNRLEWFSSSAKARRQNQRHQTLTNERLIKVLMNQNKSHSSGESVKVRLIVDEGILQSENRETPEIVTLTQAVEKSTELGVDLVAVNVKQDPPVIKAVDFSKFEYKIQKKKGGNSSNGVKSLKEFKFRAAIADNDMERKVNNLIKYLKKGHSCQIFVSANGQALRRDPDAVSNTMGRIRTRIGDAGVDGGKIKGNKQKTFASLMLQPNSRK